MEGVKAGPTIRSRPAAVHGFFEKVDASSNRKPDAAPRAPRRFKSTDIKSAASSGSSSSASSPASSRACFRRARTIPSGFILTTVLGIAGAFLATLIGQAIGHYGPDQGAGFITATIGALVVLFIWNRLVASGMISDPGNR